MCEDFMLFDFDELNGYVSNVKPADPSGAGHGGSRLRGFGLPQFRNGFGIIQQPDSNNVDRVEILQGPSAGTYGATAPGGIINFITNKPLPRPAYSLDYYSTENIRIYGTATSTTVYLPANSYRGGMMAYAFKARDRTRVTLHLAGTDLFSQQILTDNAFTPTGAQWKFSTGLKF